MNFTAQTNITWIGPTDQTIHDDIANYIANQVTLGTTDGERTVTWVGEQHSYLRNWTTVEAANQYVVFQEGIGCHSAEVIVL